MGSGKSTFLKKRFKANAAKGNFIRTFDITGEFEKLTREFGGKIIRCNGEDGMLNPLEILKAGEDDFTSYSKHISKVATFFRCILPQTDDQIVTNLEILLRDFYELYKLVPAEGRSITGQPAKNYPTFSNFLSFLDDQIENEKTKEFTSSVDAGLSQHKALIVSQIRDAVSTIVGNYGSMFDILA